MDIPQLENEATRVFVALFDFLEGRGDARTFVVDDVVGEDRRPGLASRGRGLESFLKNMDALVGIAVRLETTEPLALRGERHAIVHATFATESAFAVDVLVVVELSEAKLLSHYIVFEPDHVDEAFRELDDMLLEDPDSSSLVKFLIEISRAFDEFDAVSFRPLFATDFRFVDHRPASSGGYGSADEYLRSLAALRELVPDLRSRGVAIYGETERCALVHTVSVGTTTDGATVEYHNLSVIEVAGGVVKQIDAFRVEDVAAATSCFESRAAEI